MKKNLKPTDPRVPVGKPDGGQLAPDGERVAMNVYWHRRLADGSVVEFQEEEPASPILETKQPAPGRQRSKK